VNICVTKQHGAVSGTYLFTAACVADCIGINQLHYLNAECPFWVFNIYFYGDNNNNTVHNKNKDATDV